MLTNKSQYTANPNAYGQMDKGSLIFTIIYQATVLDHIKCWWLHSPDKILVNIKHHSLPGNNLKNLLVTDKVGVPLPKNKFDTIHYT